MNFNGVCGETQVVCGRRGHIARGIQATGRVAEFKLSESGNERRLKLLLKADCFPPILVSFYQTSSFKSYTPLKLFTYEPALFRATPLYTSPLYMETSSSKSYTFTKDSTLYEQNVIAH